MRIVTVRRLKAGDKLLRERAQIALAIIGSGDGCRGSMLYFGQGRPIGLNPSLGVDKIWQEAGFIKKPGALVLHQLRNAGDCRRQHQLSVSHGLHQNHRYPFALAGHDDQVGIAVVAGKVSARHVADQIDMCLESKPRNLPFESRTLRSLAHNPASKVEPLVAQRGAGLNEEAMVLNGMKASDGEEAEAPAVAVSHGSSWRGEHAIDPQALHDDLLRGRGREVAENMPAVEVGGGYTEITGTQLGGEQIRAPQQIGTVESEAVADAEQLSGGYSDPRGEVSMMSVDVLH